MYLFEYIDNNHSTALVSGRWHRWQKTAEGAAFALTSRHEDRECECQNEIDHEAGRCYDRYVVILSDSLSTIQRLAEDAAVPCRPEWIRMAMPSDLDGISAES